ncbi:hypothetical protein HELRODRAFT_171718 [Helobdella robusta]|uniref:Uncharacterized protein n=1 Tax=Helobdella robusta TaxID=6412 RepID=T1F4L0_HELRO|nr:hypothetical protein HELRODRAFT_171718 [Helobdella robusta]ESO05342.1 hypothetical protein HELRODRAFT_171718 [Helobdella robusta]
MIETSEDCSTYPIAQGLLAVIENEKKWTYGIDRNHHYHLAWHRHQNNRMHLSTKHDMKSRAQQVGLLRNKENDRNKKKAMKILSNNKSNKLENNEDVTWKVTRSDRRTARQTPFEMRANLMRPDINFTQVHAQSTTTYFFFFAIVAA